MGVCKFLVKVIFLVNCATNFCASSNASDYGNGRYKIYQVRPTTMEQMIALNKLESEGTLDFWRHATQLNSTGDIMIDTHKNGEKFDEAIDRFKIDTKVLVDDLASLIEERESFTKNKSSGRKMKLNLNKDLEVLRDDPTGRRRRFNDFGIRMGEYHSYAEILAFMGRVVWSLPGKAQLRNIGWSTEGRQIQGIQFGNPSDTRRPVVWIDAGFHAREWTSIHTAIYFIHYIANEMDRDARLAKVLEWVDILIFPCLNPDGYEYTRSDPRNPAVRMWRKNRAKNCAKENTGNCCNGVDLNRNFDFEFSLLTSNFMCSEIYHGSHPFSELETQAIRDAILNSDLRNRVVGLIDMHAYSQLWIYPYSHRRHSYPADIADLKDISIRAVNAIRVKFGTPYKYGTGPEIIYPYTGGSTDWAKRSANVKYTFTIELRPSELNGYRTNGFILTQSELIPTARETLDGIMVVMEACAKEAAEKVNQPF